MNEMHGITKENLLSSLPAVLAADENMEALAAAVAEVLTARVDEIGRLSIYSQIDKLPEELLDILAYDFKVDWWKEEYTLDEKRSALKSAWSVHRTKGTKHAVKEAISEIYKDAAVSEWFEYGGEPGCFRVNVDNLLRVRSRTNNIKTAIDCVKRASAHLDGMYMVKRPELRLSTAVIGRTNMRLWAETDCDLSKIVWMTDDDGNPMADSDGNILIL